LKLALKQHGNCAYGFLLHLNYIYAFGRCFYLFI